MRRSSALPPLAVTVVALVLAGCTGGDGGTVDLDEKGPLTAFYEKLGDSYTSEQSDRQQREYEEVVASCMAEQGFEYTPAEPTKMDDSDLDLPEWDSKEFAEQYGYGATTSDEMYGGSESAEEWVDPNADYIASMSETEQAAYNTALWGEMVEYDPEADPEAEPVETSWEDEGCNGQARHEVYDEDVWSDPAMEAMNEEMNTEYEALKDEPAVSKALTAWSTCMADAGFDFATPDEASSSIHDQVSALWDEAMPSEEEMAADPEASYEPDEAAMAELKKEELALAAQDYECKESSGYLKAFKTASLAMEERLWEKYGEQLEAAAAKQAAE